MFGGADQFAEKRFARNAHHERPIVHAETFQISEELEIVRKRFAETNSRIKRDGHGINPAV